MIKVTVTKDQIKVCGHSLYQEAGKDIVCASVSSIVITTINAILRLEPDAILYQEADGLMEIKILLHNQVVDTLILNMIDLLKQLELQYSKYIKIK